jgi:hypothetical protein
MGGGNGETDRSPMRNPSKKIPIGFFYGAFQPHLDQVQHAPINNSARHRF